jgi:hypothetical protein
MSNRLLFPDHRSAYALIKNNIAGTPIPTAKIKTAGKDRSTVIKNKTKNITSETAEIQPPKRSQRQANPNPKMDKKIKLRFK